MKKVMDPDPVGQKSTDPDPHPIMYMYIYIGGLIRDICIYIYTSKKLQFAAYVQFVLVY